MLEPWQPVATHTLAEKAVDRFRNQIHPDGTNRTVSLITICEWMGAKRSVSYTDGTNWGRKIIRYDFSDGSWCTSQGRGLTHQINCGKES